MRAVNTLLPHIVNLAYVSRPDWANLESPQTDTNEKIASENEIKAPHMVNINAVVKKNSQLEAVTSSALNTRDTTSQSEPEFIDNRVFSTWIQN